MYGSTLPNTGAVAVAGLGFYLDVLWLLLLAVTVWSAVLTAGRLMPRREA